MASVENGPSTDADGWTAYIEPFAAAIGMTVEEATQRLQPLVGEPGTEAADALRTEDYTPFSDLQAIFGQVPAARLRKAVAEHLRGRAAGAAAPTAITPQTSLTLDASLGILPNIPDDASLLAQLKAATDLKVSQATVILAARAALADRCGFFQLAILLIERMEQHAESLEEPVSEDFFKLRKLISQRNYAEIYEGMPGVDGTFVSQKRRDAFLQRLESLLWPALLSFHSQLTNWGASWQKGMLNPAATMALLFANSGTTALPPGMLAPPPTDSLRDAAEAVNVQINKVFAGVGVPVAMALGYDALKIKEVLENPALPAQVGAANRDQMLKMLEVAVTPDYTRLEDNLVRYLLAVMRYPTVTSEADLGFLTALTMLGGQIPWDRLTSPVRAAHRAV